MIAHYMYPLAIALCILISLIATRRRIITKIGYSWWIYIAGFVAIYVAIVWLVFCTELILINRLANLDLNGDGQYIGLERTDEYYEILNRMTKDTARKLSIYTGILYSLVITIFLFMTDLIRIHVWDRYIKKTNALDI